MDSLARDPNKFITPHNADTGETILHLLAKEGKVEILHNLLEDSRVEKDLVIALLKQDKLGKLIVSTSFCQFVSFDQNCHVKNSFFQPMKLGICDKP